MSMPLPVIENASRLGRWYSSSLICIDPTPLWRPFHSAPGPITRTRLAHAATLLDKTHAPLAEIAARGGYGNEFSFGKAFKRAFGIAPGAYRGDSNGVPGLNRAPDTAAIRR